MDDPFVNGAQALRRSLDNGTITRPQYDDMFAALAAAAEADTVRCEVEGCEDTAYIGTRCALHFDRSTLPAIVAEMRARHV